MEDNIPARFVPEMVVAAAIFVSIDTFAAIGAAAIPVMIPGGGLVNGGRVWDMMARAGVWELDESVLPVSAKSKSKRPREGTNS